jgi:hypothetical protein
VILRFQIPGPAKLGPRDTVLSDVLKFRLAMNGTKA